MTDISKWLAASSDDSTGYPFEFDIFNWPFDPIRYRTSTHLLCHSNNSCHLFNVVPILDQSALDVSNQPAVVHIHHLVVDPVPDALPQPAVAIVEDAILDDAVGIGMFFE